MLQLLKPSGRCAIVLPDGSITGDGIKARIREKLLTDCNLHTIIRLPQSTFFPATVSTNLLFLKKVHQQKIFGITNINYPKDKNHILKQSQFNLKNFNQSLTGGKLELKMIVLESKCKMI